MSHQHVLRRDPARRRRLAMACAATALVAGGGVVTAVTANAAAGCRVDYVVTNQWPGGFGTNVTIHNLGDPIEGWQLVWSFSAGQTVTELWNGTYTQNGAQVTVTNVSYNSSIPTGGNVVFGFNGSWNNVSNPVPSTFTLNGTVCTGSVGTTSTTTTSQPPTTTTSRPPTTTTTTTTSPPDGGTLPPTPPAGNAKQVERLNRGVIAVRSGNGYFVSWRLLGTDPSGVAFNVYRGSTRLNSSPITNSTNYYDAGAPVGSSYTVRPVLNGVEYAGENAMVWAQNYFDIPLQVPPGGTTPDGVSYTYSANDLSVGDVDGDGQYEIFVKWDPSNSKDNAQAGYTGNVYIDAYRLNGTRLWRIDLGRNIRAGAHYTQFQVYDYDGDGRAEIAMKTADGTRDGTGAVIGNANADYRNSSGYILSGPEYLTVFDGLTGRALSTVNYEPPRGDVSSWGDSYGNRVDRFLAATAYLDGRRPSLIMSRGYYTRTVIVAWDFRNGSLTRRWTFDSNAWGSQYTGQGNHQLSIADVDGDGRDEVMFGAMAIDDNGTPLWNTHVGHGDAYHVGDLIPSRPGLEMFKPNESGSQPAHVMVDARTGQIIFSAPPCGCDNGRGVSADIYAGSPGAESWSSAVPDLRNTSGNSIGRKPSSANFVIWWDADPVRELLDGTHIDKYSPGGDIRLLTGSGVESNNGTKATPGLSADIFGDWREEVIWRTSDSRALRVYTTTDVTDLRIPTLMHDPMYRVAIAWQNTAYNQPPHPSFFIGAGMSPPPAYNVYTP